MHSGCFLPLRTVFSMHQRMKAIVHTRYGGPEVCSLRYIPIPEPGPREVLIRVHAATVNRTDCGFRSAEYVISRLFSGLLKPKHQVLGNEFAGVIEAHGSQVTNWQVGQRVFGYNDQQFGAHAEYMLMPADGCMALIPEELSFAEAAPLTEGVHYALCDIRAARVQAGHQVLVYGATGAIGSSAVQLLRQMGAQVTAVCASQHTGLMHSLGAHRVIDYTREDYAQSGETYDFVLDAVGKTSFSHCKPVLKPNGIYISTELGRRWENIFLALAGKFRKGKKVMFPIPAISKTDVDMFAELAESGAFKPLTDRSYPLEQVVDAYRYVETGQKLGNVIIEIH
jgi:NADPH:quinone reductase-like Zn-dependent oxidoreductase